MSSIFQRLWHASPASVCAALRRRFQGRSPEWHTVRAGPAAGVHLLFDGPLEGAWLEMIEGRFDAALHEALREGPTLKDAVVWDVGAHFGYHSLAFASMGANVAAFEPHGTNAARLQANLERNSSLSWRVRVLPLALSDCDGEVEFLSGADLRGPSSGSHLVGIAAPARPEDYAGFDRVRVKCARADTLVASGAEPAPAVIKIDVEGAEWLVLQGARQLLAERRPLLLLEVHHIRLACDIVPFLQSLGYRTQVLEDPGTSLSRCFLAAR
jgi:FkbM family methyltransferase